MTRKQATTGSVSETKRPAETDRAPSSPKPQTKGSVAETKRPTETDRATSAPKQETADSDAEVERPAETDETTPSPKQETADPVSEKLPVKRRNRVQITGVRPEIEGGRYPIKRIVDDVVEITANIVADGHNALAAVLLYKEETQSEWSETPMEHDINDRWQAQVRVDRLGRWQYTVCLLYTSPSPRD